MINVKILSMDHHPENQGFLERLVATTVADICIEDLWTSSIRFLVSRVNGEESVNHGSLCKKMLERGLVRGLV